MFWADELFIGAFIPLVRMVVQPVLLAPFDIVRVVYRMYNGADGCNKRASEYNDKYDRQNCNHGKSSLLLT